MDTKKHIQMPIFEQKDLDRFWAKIRLTANPNLCWEWQNAKVGGYGFLKINHINIRSHRIAYYLSTGVDPLDLVVMHTCDNVGCCNPNHLKIGTQLDNIADMKKKKRAVCLRGDKNWTRKFPDKVKKGGKHPNSILSESDVVEIWKLKKNGIRGRAISKMFNTSEANISIILKGKAWKHIKL